MILKRLWKSWLCASVTVVSLGAAGPVKFEEAFFFVFIDQQMEERVQGPPFDRSLYAKAIDTCRELGAKGVVIKLFLDREHTSLGDEALVRAMRQIPVILQARIEPKTGTPDSLPPGFAFHDPALPTGIRGDLGWIPISRFAAVAADIGFVDFTDDRVPLLETYQKKTYKSVVVCALELQSGERARLGDKQQLLIGNRELVADSGYEKAVKRTTTPLPACSLTDLLSGRTDRHKIDGRVVILGYIGSKAPVIKTVEGEVSGHIFFGQCLRAVFEATNAENE